VGGADLFLRFIFAFCYGTSPVYPRRGRVWYGRHKRAAFFLSFLSSSLAMLRALLAFVVNTFAVCGTTLRLPGHAVCTRTQHLSRLDGAGLDGLWRGDTGTVVFAFCGSGAPFGRRMRGFLSVLSSSYRLQHRLWFCCIYATPARTSHVFTWVRPFDGTRCRSDGHTWTTFSLRLTRFGRAHGPPRCWCAFGFTLMPFVPPTRNERHANRRHAQHHYAARVARLHLFYSIFGPSRCDVTRATYHSVNLMTITLLAFTRTVCATRAHTRNAMFGFGRNMPLVLRDARAASLGDAFSAGLVFVQRRTLLHGPGLFSVSHFILSTSSIYHPIRGHVLRNTTQTMFFSRLPVAHSVCRCASAWPLFSLSSFFLVLLYRGLPAPRLHLFVL